ncbi:hypothetical protein OHA40_29655 [Nocardia sp. NBC_00508]|uniref:hypothetical protein n=1 Tax=Nocardia sp. NBC_00508 TaxID=2975992 RepID=UPI002E7FB98B|nr:hypothetical protein [Nocardia sp. NBC_00508]WUD65731.1 hypothetical protein OHA40_29655 [Nocardia sp. NBC_00508]
MRATVGVSAEQTVVRGVMLSSTAQQGAPPTVLREVEQPVEYSVAASIAATLAALTSAEADTEIDDVAVAYRTGAERRAIVSHLSSAAWGSPSLVSTKTALLALLDGIPGLAAYGTVLVLEVVGYHTTYLVVGPRRDEILASDSWSGVVDAGTAGQAIDRIRPALEAAGLQPDAVLLCGSSAGRPDLVSALQLGLATPVITAPDFANAAAYGAALVAAASFRSASAVAIPAGRRQTGRAILVAAAIAALAGGVAVAVVQAREDRPAEIRGPAGPAPGQAPISEVQPIFPAPAVDPIFVAPAAAPEPAPAPPYPQPPIPPEPLPVPVQRPVEQPPPMPPDLPGQPGPSQPPHRPHPTTTSPEHAPAPAGASNDTLPLAR